MGPAMGATFLFGIGLILADATIRGWGFLAQPWMLAKLAGIVFLAYWHGYLSAARKRFEAGTNAKSEKFWRATNELPFLAAIIMVIAVTTEFGRP
jgi:putative membrane protein